MVSPSFAEFEQAHAGFGRARYHRPDGRIDPRDGDASRPVRLSWRTAEDAFESVAESAVRFVAGIEYHVVDFRARTNLRERRGQSPRPHVGLKRHSILRLEMPPHAGWLQAQVLQLG